MLCLLSILEGLYIIYMLRFFKTKYSLAHPFTYVDSDYLRHPIGISEKPQSKVCKFGHQASWYLALYLVLRCVLLNNNVLSKETIITINRLVLLGVFSLSFLNFNVVLYLLPIFILEYKVIKLY